MNRIELFKTNQGWMADFQGPQAEEIRRLFGTSVIPTPFTAQAESANVMANIQSKNPDCIVVLR